MEDELQTEDDGITLDQDQTQGDEENSTDTGNGAELAPAPEEKQDKANDGAQKAINKQHAKYREEERKRIAAETEAKQLKEKLEKIEAEKGDVTVPPAPDPYDEDYEEKLKAREDAIAQKARQEAQKQVATERLEENKKAAAEAETQRFNDLVSGYNQRVNKLGLSADEIRSAGETVINNGIDGQVAEYILGDEDGPLITKYLAENPIIQDELRGLTTIQAALKINSEIKLAAATMKPQSSEAPDPAEILSGRGAGEKVSELIKGATFE